MTRSITQKTPTEIGKIPHFWGVFRVMELVIPFLFLKSKILEKRALVGTAF
jgi:hypothetical protein